MEINDIGRVCHEANRALCIALGDDTLPEWDGLDQSYKDSTLKGVKLAVLGNTTPESQHAEWMKERLSQGWKYGPILDRANKVHPNLVPYHKLAESQQKKDHLFRAIVLALKD